LDEVETNLVFFEVDPKLGNAGQLSAALLERGVKIGASGPQRLRACTHLDVRREDIPEVARILREAVQAGFRQFKGSSTGPYARA
jgi:threonine aldolase